MAAAHRDNLFCFNVGRPWTVERVIFHVDKFARKHGVAGEGSYLQSATTFRLSMPISIVCFLRFLIFDFANKAY